MSRLMEFAGTREITVNLTLRELRSRYKRSVLGWTWSLINPLATVLVYTIVFSFFLKIEPRTGHPSGLQSFALFLLCGLIPWNFFANGLNMGLGAIVGNGNLIKKIYFHREILVFAATGSLVATLVIELGVLCLILLAAGNMVLPWLPVVLLIVVLQTGFVTGLTLMLSVCNVYFRDVQHFISILIQVLFYSAPIVYPISYVPDHAQVLGMTIPIGEIYRLNPLVTIVESYRYALYDLRFPPLLDLAYLALWSIVMLGLGMWVFGKLDARLAEEV